MKYTKFALVPEDFINMFFSISKLTLNKNTIYINVWVQILSKLLSMYRVAPLEIFSSHSAISPLYSGFFNVTIKLQRASDLDNR